MKKIREEILPPIRVEEAPDRYIEAIELQREYIDDSRLLLISIKKDTSGRVLSQYVCWYEMGGEELPTVEGRV